jgi:hypothetical protein
MTYDQAVVVMRAFGEGNMLRGLKWMGMEMEVIDQDGNPMYLTDAQVDAWYVIKRTLKQVNQRRQAR